jgi:hypothetical protein
MKVNDIELESLKKQRQSLKKQLYAVSEKIDKAVIHKLLPEYRKRYVETYWIKKNGYDNKDTWPVYIHVTAINDIWDTAGNGINCMFTCDTFQCNNCDEISIFLGTEEYVGSLGKPITKPAYEKAKQALLNKLMKQL